MRKMQDKNERSGLLSRIRSSAARVTKPLLEIGLTESNEYDALLSETDALTKIESMMNIHEQKPTDLYKIDERTLKLHPLTRQKRYVCKDREDQTLWIMTMANGKKRAAVYEFGVFGLCRHENILRLRETILFENRYYIFMELPPGNRSLKSILFQPNHKQSRESVRNLRELSQTLDLQRDNSLNFPEPNDQNNIPYAILSPISSDTSPINPKALPGFSPKKVINFKYHPWPEEMVSYVLHQVLKGITYLHKNNVIHRDIRSVNIQIDRHGRVLISDMLYSKVLNKQYPRAKTCIGTVWFMAPEVMRGWEYNQLSDIWSFGIFSLEVAEGVVPNKDIKNQAEIMKITIRDPPPELSNVLPWSFDFSRMLKSCLNHNSSARSSAEKLLGDKFFSRSCGQDEFASFLESFS